MTERIPQQLPEFIVNNFDVHEQPVHAVSPHTPNLLVAQSRTNHSYSKDEFSHRHDATAGDSQDGLKQHGLVYRETELGGQPFIVADTYPAEEPLRSEPEPAEPETPSSEPIPEHQAQEVEEPLRSEPEPAEPETPSSEPIPEHQEVEELEVLSDQEATTRIADYFEELRDATYVPTPEEFAEMRSLSGYITVNQGQHNSAMSYTIGDKKINSYMARTFLDATKLSKWMAKEPGDLEYIQHVLHLTPSDVPALKNRRFEHKRNYMTFSAFKGHDDARVSRTDEASLRRYQAYLQRVNELDSELATNREYHSDPEFRDILRHINRRDRLVKDAIDKYRAHMGSSEDDSH